MWPIAIYGILEIFIYFWCFFIALDMFEKIYIFGNSSFPRTTSQYSTSVLLRCLAQIPFNPSHEPMFMAEISRSLDIITNQLNYQHFYNEFQLQSMESSRFTDSKKYENDFIECFQLASPRKGEICNACVLLVKRFKRLPPGSDRHWGHVVDARVGPGLKSMTKFKKRKEEQLQQQLTINDGSILPAVNITSTSISRSLSSVPEKFCKIFKKNKKKKLLECEALASEKKSFKQYVDQNLIEMDEDGESPVFPIMATSPNHCSSINDLLCDEMLDSPSSPLSQTNSDDNDQELNIYNKNENQRFIMKNNEMNRNFIEQILNVHESSRVNHQNRRQVCKRKIRIPVRNFGSRIVKENSESFIDTKYWKKVKTCCGYVYESNITNAIIIDCNLYKICVLHKNISNTSNALPTPFSNGKILNTEKENFGTTFKTVTDTTVLPVTAMKKHHLYSKRQNFINSSANSNSIIYNSSNNNKTEVNILQPPLIIPPIHGTIANTINNPAAAKYLHKMKSDSKIIKAGDIKPTTISAAKLKASDYNLVKNLMKICTDKAVKHKHLDNNKLVNGDGVVASNTPDVLGNKFSDNSSDSGYEETPLEHVNQIPLLKKPTHGVRSVVLANGIKVHVQPQNLERAVNWAGVPQTTVPSLQQTENLHFNSSPQSNIIVVQQKPTIDLILPNQSASNNQMIIDTMGTANISSNSSATNLSQNIVLIKPKYLPQNC